MGLVILFYLAARHSIPDFSLVGNKEATCAGCAGGFLDSLQSAFVLINWTTYEPRRIIKQVEIREYAAPLPAPIP